MPQTSEVRETSRDIRLSSRDRLIKANYVAARFEDRLCALEEAMKVKREERQEQEQIALQWELCDRLAQDLNDHLKNTVMNSKNKKLYKAKELWSTKNPVHYLPLFFTKWWIQWNRELPEQFPLPAVLPSFSEEERDVYCQERLPTNIDEAAENLWESQQSIIEIMLELYHMRSKCYNGIQRPVPSSTSALQFIQSNPHLSEEEKVMATLVVQRETGNRCDTSGKIPLFTHSHTPGPSRSTIRQREVDDEGIDDEGVRAKKQRRGE